jgi:phage anti-repressor protein
MPKRTLKNNFSENIDYKIYDGEEVTFARPVGRAKKEVENRGGHNKEKVLLNTETFKNLCMIARTDLGKRIRTYYVKLETIFNSMIKETINEMRESQITKNKEIEKKNNEIQQLNSKIESLQESEINHIYIGWNPKIKNIHKIGISSNVMLREESHRSSNPDFVYLYTYETKNAKVIEDSIKFMLKNFKVKKPEWFTISYKNIKSVLDFCAMMHETYSIHESVENLVYFIERYRNNRLINTCVTRVLVENTIYNEYLSENIVTGDNYKVTIGMIRENFYKWYLRRFNGDVTHHIKTPVGEWSTEFTKELLKKVETYTKLKSKNVNVRDRLRGFNYLKHTGFVGISIKSIVDDPGKIYPEEVYKDYINSKIIILEDEPRYKISRMELLEDFHKWIETSNKYVYNRNMFAEVKFTQEFINEFINSIEKITGKKYYKNLVKKTHRGCFLSMKHVTIDCEMNMSPVVVDLINSGIRNSD